LPCTLLRRQAEQLKEYANAKGVRLVGDLPFFVSPDASDVREAFQKGGLVRTPGRREITEVQAEISTRNFRERNQLS
jgi:hypothetical protein